MFNYTWKASVVDVVLRAVDDQRDVADLVGHRDKVVVQVHHDPVLRVRADGHGDNVPGVVVESRGVVLQVLNVTIYRNGYLETNTEIERYTEICGSQISETTCVCV